MSNISNYTETFTTTELEEKIQLIKQELNNEHHEFLNTEVKNIATGYAQNNYPRENDRIDLYIGKIKAYYLKLKSEVPLKISGQLELIKGSMEIGVIEQKIKKCDEERNILDKERWQLENQYKKAGTPINVNSFKWKEYSIWLIGLIEVIGYIACFVNVLNDNYVWGIVLGISIGVTSFLLVKSAVLDFRDNNVKSKKRFWVIGALLLIMAVVLGGLRYAGTIADDPNAHMSFFANPVIFIVTNIIILLSSGYFIYMYYPSKKELEYVESYKKLKEDLDNKTKELKAKESEIDDLKETKNAVARYRLQMRHYQQILIERIGAMYLEAVNYFMEINLKTRTDRVFPLAFNEPIPPLDITNEDYTISNLLK